MGSSNKIGNVSCVSLPTSASNLPPSSPACKVFSSGRRLCGTLASGGGSEHCPPQLLPNKQCPHLGRRRWLVGRGWWQCAQLLVGRRRKDNRAGVHLEGGLLPKVDCWRSNQEQRKGRLHYLGNQRIQDIWGEEPLANLGSERAE